MKQLVDRAVYELLHYPEKTAGGYVKTGIRKLTGRYVAPNDKINWPCGLLANGLVDYYKNHINSEEAAAIMKALKQYFSRWIKRDCKIYYMDDILSGMALIELEQLTKEESYKKALERMLAYLVGHEMDQAGSLPYRPAQKNNHIYADGIGMICPFLCRYTQVYHDIGANAAAIRQIKNFIAYGMDAKTGLPYHGYEYESGRKHGIIGWGRAVGWLMLGMVDSLAYMDKEQPEYDEIKQAFRRLVDKVEMYQLENGMYAWQLEAREGAVDTSATAMILLAIAKGLKNEVLIGIHRSRMLRGRDGLKNYIEDGKVKECLAECQGFSMYPQIYGAYPWSLGPTLSLLTLTEDMN